MKDKTIFKEKLYQHTMPVREGLWEAIEAKLPPKKEERIFPLFWITLFATTLLGGALMIGLFTQKNTTSTPSNHLQNEPILSTAVNSPHLQTAHVDITNTSASSANSTSLTNNTSELLNSKSIVTNKIPPNKIESTNTLSNKNEGKQSSAKVKANTKTDIQLVENVNEESSSALAYLAPNQKRSPTSESFSRAFPNVDFLPLSQTLLTSEAVVAEAIPAQKPDPSCYKFTGPGSQWAISADVLGGPGFSPKTYEQNSGEYSIYADAREATENNQYAWSVGARLNLHHRSGLTGRIGITYSQAGDMFDYTDSLATQSTTRIDSFFAADGTFLYEETSQVLILGTLIKKIHNTYKYLDIPLLVGYELPLGRSILMINAGPVLNLTSSHEGQILDSMLHPRSITDGEPGAIDVYKTNLGFSIYLGAGMVFPLSDHFSGLVEPSFLYRLTPVTLGSYPLKEHRHYVGLNLGLRYHFN